MLVNKETWQVWQLPCCIQHCKHILFYYLNETKSVHSTLFKVLFPILSLSICHSLWALVSIEAQFPICFSSMMGLLNSLSHTLLFYLVLSDAAFAQMYFWGGCIALGEDTQARAALSKQHPQSSRQHTARSPGPTVTNHCFDAALIWQDDVILPTPPRYLALPVPRPD